MRNLVLSTIIALWCSFAAAQGAGKPDHQHYKWHDGQGNLHYDDVLPDEALKYGYDVVSSAGIVVKHVDRPRTPEELKAEKNTAEKAAATKRAQDEKTRTDQQMLAAYPSEQDLESAQREQLAVIDQTVQATQASLQNQEKSLSEMLAHAADLDRTGKPVPTPLQQQIDTLRISIEKQKAYIVGKNAEKDSDAQRFAAELAHYREVKTRVESQQQ